ncbi:alkaline phosphatase [Steroidobacter agaridevorans]|uniref:Alkaline phosphatase n=1 Tax=Steroidobacter agaridevorans TaxID=2695856 RepID=A0A829YBF7_9GAMM|nr:alkaline phosphatase D family protein [Steroidobacter agaridevorans]GFE80221.1 alkaline phosphatase [Steroidobacter agaridevorans]GFE89809.1 alkaline phosphatase [Steroidobacter agaridevorans]
MTRFSLERRTLLLAGGQAALFAALARTPVLAAPKFLENPFSLGVASGDPTADGFVIWTRLAPRPLEPHGGMPTGAVELAWEVAEDDAFRKNVRSGKALARPELAHSVHVEISGLRSHRRYWYRFVIEGIASDVGAVRTAPAADAAVDRLRFAVAGCQHYERGLFTAWRHVSQESDLDFVYHYGDYIYEGKAAAAGMTGKAPIVRRHTGNELYSLDDYRQRYALYKMDPDLKAAHAAAAFLSSFDDHEVDNNWASDLDSDNTPPEIFQLRRTAAMQAWYEHMPVRMNHFPYNGAPQTYRRLDFGRLLRAHVLDKRSYRSIRLCEKTGDGNCVDERDGSDTMLGNAQERWLSDGLSSGSAWNLLALGGLVMPFDRSAQKVPSNGYDNWTGYPDARQRLVELIQARSPKNVVIAGGDSHMFFIGHLPSVPHDLESAPIAPEFHATSISSISTNGVPIGADPRAATNPHISMIHDQRGYLLFDVEPHAVQSSARVIDQAITPGGAVSTLARFVVTSGRAEVSKL